MINYTYALWGKYEYKYPVKGSFIPNIVTYIHEEDKKLSPCSMGSRSVMDMA